MPSSSKIAAKLLVWTLRKGGGASFVGESGFGLSGALGAAIMFPPLRPRVLTQ